MTFGKLRRGPPRSRSRNFRRRNRREHLSRYIKCGPIPPMIAARNRRGRSRPFRKRIAPDMTARAKPRAPGGQGRWRWSACVFPTSAMLRRRWLRMAPHENCWSGNWTARLCSDRPMP
jgi:hypothetical protein